MDFDFTDDQHALRDAVARWVQGSFSFARRHALAKAGGRTRDVYSELAGLGLTSLAVPAEHGGMGFGPVEAMVVMEELGRGLVNAPYAAAALVAPALLVPAPAALQARWLPRIADGSALVVPAWQEAGARYRLANRFAARYVRSLERRFVAAQDFVGMRRALRAFWREGQTANLRLAREAA